MPPTSMSDAKLSHDNSPNTKKAKKTVKTNHSTASIDHNDRAALDKRAQRFQREHDLEREKSRVGGQAALKANHSTSHLFSNSNSRYASPSPFGQSDDPEADPVRDLVHESSLE